MKIAGIVAEYNPFHNGHAYHIERTKDAVTGCGATHIVAVMSGNFVQRGEPAILPKSERVSAALAGGADLVLELPLPWAMASAETFSYGAVSILDSLGCVEVLSFGSESGDLDLLSKAADALESDRFSGLLRLYLDMGISFPDARQRAVREIAGSKIASLFKAANNILGIEYLKALRRLNSNIRPFTIQRFGAGHDEELPVGDIASASAIRRMIYAGRVENAASFLPLATRNIIHKSLQDGRCPVDIALIEPAVLGALRLLSPEDYAKLPDVSEGLENRLYEAARKSGSLEELMFAVKTKRYPLSRIRRIIMAGFLGLKAGHENRKPPYIRVLGFNRRGSEILSLAKNSKIPLVSRVSRFETLDGYAREVFELEVKAADLYSLAAPKAIPCGSEYTYKIIKVDM
ncbi:MAG TPA: nucleotidyltransferase [Candidatus Avimonas sp.]|nr:nucleotidyltransferase [Clostridiales bacterium]HOB36012.1 nucleotidyltransferase [Candidatus Avimonas sp.]HQA15542.1 nucleotidyltransferase [Candidatus Avimonas sp.]HQD37572.1 nucleotidyltransferase [Candidatus Avimonas sp.]